jgi:hypothetical protein
VKAKRAKRAKEAKELFASFALFATFASALLEQAPFSADVEGSAPTPRLSSVD